MRRGSLLEYGNCHALADSDALELQCIKAAFLIMYGHPHNGGTGFNMH